MSRVMIVDDSLENLLVACAALEAGGHQVVGTTNPEEAVEIVRRGEVDAAILDIVMPRMSGFALLRLIRQSPLGEGLPVLFLSGVTGPSAHVRGLTAGADDYLDKPINPQELLARVDRLLSRFGGSGEQLSGSFSGLSLTDLLQVLADARRSAALRLVTQGRQGAIRLEQGRITRVACGPHEGRRALLQLLEAGEGHFRLAGAEGAGAAEGSGEGTIDLRECLLESAWVADELHRRVVLLPEDDGRYAAVEESAGKPLRQDHVALPLEAVLAAIRGGGSLSLTELLAAELGPERHVRLAVAVLLEQGWIRCEGRTVPGGIPDGDEGRCSPWAQGGVGTGSGLREVGEEQGRGPGRDR